MVRAYRIVKERWASDPMSGKGAAEYPGRWNSAGVRMTYTSGSASLALLEILVHVKVASSLSTYVLFETELPDSVVQNLSIDALPQNWVEDPPPPELKDIGDEWVSVGSSLVLRVPSAIVPTEFSYLINPLHPDFGELKITGPTPFPIDPRLIAQ